MFYLVNTIKTRDGLNIQAYFPAALLGSLLQNGTVVTAVSNLAFSLHRIGYFNVCHFYQFQ